MRGAPPSWATVGALVAALGLVSCSGAGARSGSENCRELPKNEASGLPELEAATTSGGTLLVEIGTQKSALESALDREIPRVLAERKDHPIGAPGLATFQVTRGKPKVKTKDGNLLVVLPLTIDISVCKPLGGLCVGYGKCRPRYDVTLAISPEVDEHYELETPRLDAKNREGCTIALDVTDHVTAAVDGELRKLRPVLRKFAERASDELRALAEVATLPSGPSGGPCAFVTPERVTAVGFTERDGKLLLGAALDFELGDAVACSERREKRPLPPVTWKAGKSLAPDAPTGDTNEGANARGTKESARGATKNGPIIRLVESLPTSEVEARVRAALARASTPPSGDVAATGVTTASTETGTRGSEDTSFELRALRLGGDALALDLEAKGASCGTFTAVVRLGAQGERVIVRHVEVPGLAANDSLVLLLRERLGTLRLLELALPNAAGKLLEEAARSAKGPEVRACGIEAHLTRTPERSTRLVGTTAGLSAVTELDGRLGLDLTLGQVGKGCLP